MLPQLDESARCEDLLGRLVAAAVDEASVTDPAQVREIGNRLLPELLAGIAGAGLLEG